MWLKGIKLSIIAVFINYYFFSIVLGHLVPHVSIVCYVIMLICYALDNGSKIRIYSEIRIWIIYLLFCVMVCPLQDSTNFIFTSLIDFAQRICLCLMVVYICERDGDIRYSLRLISFLSLISTITILFMTNNYSIRVGYEGSAADISTNDFGSLLAFGCAAIVLYFWSRREKKVPITFDVGSTLIYLLGIMLSGSRKAIYSVIIFYALIVLLCGKKIFRNLSISRMISFVFIIVIVGSFSANYLISFFEKTSLYSRLFGYKALNAGSSDQGRMRLIIQGLEEFIMHPFIGIGFNNFVLKHGNYTHCTYVESLASSGLFGILYLIPFIKVFKKQTYLIKTENKNSYFQCGVMCFYIMFLFCGWGIPYIYKDVPNLLFGTFIGNQYLEVTKS